MRYFLLSLFGHRYLVLSKGICWVGIFSFYWEFKGKVFRIIIIIILPHLFTLIKYDIIFIRINYLIERSFHCLDRLVLTLIIRVKRSNRCPIYIIVSSKTRNCFIYLTPQQGIYMSILLLFLRIAYNNTHITQPIRCIGLLYIYISMR